jgi:predicted PurR-regulated permease PerM
MMDTPWSRTTRILVLIGGLGLLIWLVIAASPLVVALGISALLAFLLDPLVQRLTRRTRLNRLWAARVVYIVLLLILAGIPAILSTVALSQFDNWQADFVAATNELKAWLNRPVILLGFQFYPLALLDNLEQVGTSALSSMSGEAVDALRRVSTNFLWGLTVLVSLYYFLTDGPKVKPWLIDLFPDKYQMEVGLLLAEIEEAWRVFLRAQLIIFLIFFALLGSGLFLVVWLYRTELLPLSPLGLIVLLVIVYAVVQQIDNFLVRPYFFGQSLELHPGLVLVGLIGGLAFGGVLGIIVVVPCLATARILGHYVHCRLLGRPPWPDLVQGPAADEATDEPQEQDESDFAPATLKSPETEEISA